MFSRRLGRAVLAALLCLPAAATAGGGFDWVGRIELDADGLASDDPAVRAQAVMALAAYAPALSAPYLLRALDDDEDAVRLEAGRALGRGGIEAAAPVVVDWLGDGDPRVRQAAAEILGGLGTPEATAALVRSLGDPDPAVRVRAVDALGRIGVERGEPAVVGPLVARLDDEKTEVRRASVLQLEKLGDRRAVVPMVAVVDDSSLEVRKAAIRALGVLGDPVALPALLRLLDDGAPEVRDAAVGALGAIGDAAAVDELVDRLGVGAESSRARIALALGQVAFAVHQRGAWTPSLDAATRDLVAALATPSRRSAAREALKVAGAAAVPALVAHLGGELPGEPREAVTLLRDARDRRATAALVAELDRGRVPAPLVLEALAAAGDPDAVVPVLGMTASPDPALRLAAMTALGPLLGGDARAADALAERLDDSELEVRVLAAEYLGALRAARAAPRLLELVGPGNPQRLRLAAIDALGTIGDDVGAAALVGVLRDGPAELHGAAATALSYVASLATVPDLVALARDDRGPTRHHAVRALGAVLRGQAGGAHAATVRALLTELADTGAPPVAAAAFAALAALGDRAVTPDLLTLLDVGGADRQRAAAWALGELGDPAAVPALVGALGRTDDRVTADVAWALGEIAASSAQGRAAVQRAAVDPLVRAARKGGWATAIDATAALARLAESGAPAVAEALAGLLHHRSKLVRLNAARGLAAAAPSAWPSATVAALAALLDGDGSARVRAAAATALGRALVVGDGAPARAALQAAAQDRDEGVRAAVSAALAGTAPAAPARDEWRVFYVVDPEADDRPVRQEAYFVIGGDDLAWATYTDARGQLTRERFPAGDATVAPQSRESEF